MATQFTRDYIAHRSAAVPFTDPLPALSTIGYSAAKGMVLSGYAPTPTEAIHALLLQWQAFKPDCSYTEFGTSTGFDDAGNSIASAILATPASPTR